MSGRVLTDREVEELLRKRKADVYVPGQEVVSEKCWKAIEKLFEVAEIMISELDEYQWKFFEDELEDLIFRILLRCQKPDIPGEIVEVVIDVKTGEIAVGLKRGASK